MIIQNKYMKYSDAQEAADTKGTFNTYISRQTEYAVAKTKDKI